MIKHGQQMGNDIAISIGGWGKEQDNATGTEVGGLKDK
jgi:hypothetical protein